jgi:hypothetical protein
MRFLPTFLIGLPVFGFVQDASAFTCATFSKTGTILTVNTTFYENIPCTGVQSVVLNSTEFAALLQLQTDVAALQASGGGAVLTTFDPALAGSLWMFAISIILGCWVLAKNAGMIIDIIKRW